jgi:hypothetical protein
MAENSSIFWDVSKENIASSCRAEEYAKRARSEQQAASFLLVAWHILHVVIASHPRRWSLPREPQIQYSDCLSSQKEDEEKGRKKEILVEPKKPDYDFCPSIGVGDFHVNWQSGFSENGIPVK